MKYVIAVLLFISVVFAQRDPWEPYENNGKGFGGNPHSPVPEPAIYGAVFTALSISFVTLMRKRKK
jgi:hypothetical protein